MNYKTLTVEQTSIWIGNIEKTISLLDTMLDIYNARMTLMDEQYKENYHTGWRKYYYDKKYWIGGDGTAYPMGSFRKASKVQQLSIEENTLRYFIYTDYNNDQIKTYKDVHERWSKYAKQPFEVHESDIIFYQEMKRFHAKAIRMAKLLGMEYEAFNLDEDS